MKYLADIMQVLNESQTHIVFLGIGFVLLFLGTTRLKHLTIVPKYRILLNWVGIGDLVVSLVILIMGAILA